MLDFSVPVLLQQLLQSMEDPAAPMRAAITYASFSLVVRLIATQSSVFTYWFSRRCYERSRGEMITMLYEKTLARKIIGIQQKPAGEDGQANGTSKSSNTTPTASQAKSVLGKVNDFLKTPYRLWNNPSARNKLDGEPKQPASMGKILNLMR